MRGSARYIKVYDGPGDTVVFLHGFLSSKAYWKKLLPHFIAQDYRVVVIDLLGFGSAPKPKNIDYTYNDHMEHIAKTMKQVGVSRGLILVGHSMGGLLAARWAKLHPNTVQSLALINPPLYASMKQVRQTLRSTGPFYRILLDSRYRHLLWIVLRTIGPISSHIRHSREGSLRNVIEAAEFVEDLSAVTADTLVLIGTRDRKEYMLNAKGTVFDKNIQLKYTDATHHAAREDAELVARNIFSFLAKSDAS